MLPSKSDDETSECDTDANEGDDCLFRPRVRGGCANESMGYDRGRKWESLDSEATEKNKI